MRITRGRRFEVQSWKRRYPFCWRLKSGALESVGATAEKIRVADDVERRYVKLGAPPPDRQGKVGADPGGFAERQCQRLHELSSGRLIADRLFVFDHCLAP